MSVVPSKSLIERLDPYLAIVGPMAMIVMLMVFMGIAEPARYFRLSNLNIILLEICRILSI